MCALMVSSPLVLTLPPHHLVKQKSAPRIEGRFAICWQPNYPTLLTRLSRVGLVALRPSVTRSLLFSGIQIVKPGSASCPIKNTHQLSTDGSATSHTNPPR